MKPNQVIRMREINYVVLSTPRSGSNALFSLLRNNAIFSRNHKMDDTEPFHPKLLSKVIYENMDLKLFIQKKFDEYAILSNNERISGFKIFVSHIEDFIKKYNSVNNTNITKYDFFSFVPKNTKYIILTRKNKIEQAVSLYKARITDEWFEGTNKKTKHNLPFNFSKINSCLIELQKKEAKGFDLLNKLNTEYMTLEYETYTRNTTAELSRIFKYLGVNRQTIIDTINLRIQRDLNSKSLSYVFSVLYMFFILRNKILHYLK